jgi:hypothetical protein
VGVVRDTGTASVSNSKVVMVNPVRCWNSSTSFLAAKVLVRAPQCQ